jgi:hypothetical protein
MMPPYVAGPHPWADKLVFRYFSNGFGQLTFVHGNPLAHQFDGSFLIGFVCKEIPHDTRFSLGIESRDPDVPSSWHLWHHAPQPSLVNTSPVLVS